MERSDVTRQEPAVPNASLKHDLQPWNALQVLETNFTIISGAVWSRESRLAFGRVLRTTAAVRPHLTAPLLSSFISKNLSPSKVTAGLLQYLQSEASVRF